MKPGSVQRARAWAKKIANRGKEAAATLLAEGVEVESAFLDSTAEGNFLVYYMRTESLEKAARVAAESDSAIDEFHRAFKRDTWLEVRKLELLVDVRRVAV